MASQKRYHNKDTREYEYETRYGEHLVSKGWDIKIIDRFSHIFDFYFKPKGRDRHIGIIEYKRRYYTMDHLESMGGVWIEYKKYSAAMQYLSLQSKGEFYFIYEMNPDIYPGKNEVWGVNLRRLYNTEFKFDVQGRMDRGDPADILPMMYFNNHDTNNPHLTRLGELDVLPPSKKKT